MAEPTKPPARVPVLAPDPKTGRMRFATVEDHEVHLVEKAGGRVLTKQEQAEQAVADRYAGQSTLQKAAGIANTVGAVATGNVLALGADPSAPTPIAAYGEGVRQGVSAGLSEVGTKAAVEAVAGKAAGQQYAKQAEELKTAHAGMYGAGELTGMVGGSVLAGSGAAGLATPAGAIAEVGNLAEQAAAKGLAGVAGRGVLGRAVAAGGEMAARGAIEGGLYNVAQQASEQIMGDPETVADKVFAMAGTAGLWDAAKSFAEGAAYGGALSGGLGVAGSLAKSGAGAAKGGLARAMARGVEMPTSIKGAAKGAADDLAFDALGTTRKVADKINKDVKGGTREVGRWVNENVLRTAAEDTTLSGVVRGGRADELLPLIQAKNAETGARIGDVVKPSGVRVNVHDLQEQAFKLHAEMRSDPTKIQGADAFRQRIDQTFEAWRNGGQIAPDGTMALSDAYYGRSGLEKTSHELGKGGAAKDAFESWLRGVDDHLVTKLDEAAAAGGKTGLREEIEALKRDYHLGKAAEKAALDGTNRIKGNNILGLREGIAAGVGAATALTSDDPIYGPAAAGATALGGRFLRQRGAAAGAYLLSRLAETTALAKTVRAFDDQIGRSARGMLEMPKKAPLPEPLPTERPRVRAEKIVKQVTEAQTNPEAFVEKVSRHTEPLANSAPQVAGALARRMTDVVSFLASKIPGADDKDPFDPHPMPKMTDGQAAELARYGWYVERPGRFFEEAAHGKFTWEGAEVAQAFMPGAFAELQERTATALATHLASGKSINYQRRLVIDQLLDMNTLPSRRPEHMAFLQAGLVPSTEAAKAPKRPSSPIKPQRSFLDSLEEHGPGRRR